MNKKSAKPAPVIANKTPHSVNSHAQQDPSLETSLVELESLVHRLETGKDELDTAFKLYERAEEIVSHAQKKLSTYEKKLRIITQKGETLFKSTTQDDNFEET